MQVQDIELQAGHGVYLPLQVLYAEKMPGHVLHETPPLEAGRVLHLHAGDNACGRVPQRLQGLHGVEGPGAVGGLDLHTPGGHPQAVSSGHGSGTGTYPHVRAGRRSGRRIINS